MNEASLAAFLNARRGELRQGAVSTRSVPLDAPPFNQRPRT